MLKITRENPIINGTMYDYELDNGDMLHPSEWNGDVYTVKRDGCEVTYRPVYADEENDNGGYDIIGFTEH